MSDADDHIDCDQARELIDSHASAEKSPEMWHILQSHVAGCRACSQELHIAVAARDVVRRAVNSVEIPSSLRERVRQVATGLTPIGQADSITHGDVERRVDRSWWRYAAAVAIALLGGWYLFLAVHPSRPSVAGAPGERSRTTVATGAIERELAEVLRIGVSDHVHCGVAFHSSPEEQYTPDQIIDGLGEFQGLVPIIRERLASYRVSMAHRCTIGGRRFVHLVLWRDHDMVSLAITLAHKGEVFPDGATPADTLPLPVYQAHLDIYHSAGFRAGEYLVFVVGEHSPEENIRMASALAMPLAELLETIKERG